MTEANPSTYETQLPVPDHNEQSDDTVTPFAEFILKVHSRCNLACTYCYMYEMADQSWREQPKIMTDEIVDQTATRIGEHLETYDRPRAHVIFHGGEPLLAEQARPGFLERTVGVMRQAMPEGRRVSFGMQTNGTLLTRPTLDMLGGLGVSVGISIDGDKAANDTYRTYRNGRGSFDDVMRGVELLQDYPDIYAGVLCTVNPDNDPLQTYRALKDCKPPSVDFLLPLANWNTLPPRHDPAIPTTVYADWLIPIFDAWYADANAPRVRLFDEAARLLLGQSSRIEYLGLTPPANVVVETDGTIAEVDTLKSAREGMTNTGLHVFENSFSEALGNETLRLRQMGKAALGKDCLDCAFLEVCGGGYFPHRYKQDESGESFANRSVYCADLLKLLGHIGSRLQQDLRQAGLLTSDD